MSKSYEEIRQYHATLTERAKNGTLTEQQLDDAVGTVVDMPDDYSRSVGFYWIKKNIDAFCQAVDDVPAFLWRHVGNHYFGVLVVLRAELLELLPEPDRARYIRTSVMQHGTRNTGWVFAAKKVGVTNEQLAEIVLDRLRTTVVQANSANFLDEFLQYGYEHEWAVLTDEQLETALMICALKSPVNVLTKWSDIWARLGDEQSRAIMIVAADQIDQVHHLRVLRQLPIETQRSLLRRIDQVDMNLRSATAKFIVEVALELGVDFYHEMQSVIKQIDPANFLSTVYATLQASKGKGGTQKENAEAIERFVLQRCDDEGYLIGTVIRGTYFDRNSQQERRQLKVQVGRYTYVENRNGSHRRYFPKEGDVVIFHPTNGRQLTPSVTAVHFIQVGKD
jgi:hypothetical protein